MRRSLAGSRQDAIVANAIEMFVVSDLVGSQPASAEKDRFSPAIRGKMSSNQTWSGAPFVARVEVSSKALRDRSDTGPSEALIR